MEGITEWKQVKILQSISPCLRNGNWFRVWRPGRENRGVGVIFVIWEMIYYRSCRLHGAGERLFKHCLHKFLFFPYKQYSVHVKTLFFIIRTHFSLKEKIYYLPTESGFIKSVWEVWGNTVMVSSLDPKEVKVFPEKYIPCKSFSDPTLRMCHETLSPKHISSPGRFPYMYPFMATRHWWRRKENSMITGISSNSTKD